MPTIRLLATDLDDTLIGARSEFHLYETWRQTVQEIRERDNGVWAVCTSRRLRDFHRVFSPMRAMGLRPDFVVARHAYLYRPAGRFGYVPRVLWNAHIWFVHWRLTSRANRLARRCRFRLQDLWPDARFRKGRRFRFSVTFGSEENLLAAGRQMRGILADFPALKVLRFDRTLALLDIPFTKGLAVAEIARHLHLTKESILAVGDGLNDLSMLDGTVAGMTGCPRNARADVMKAVAETGGHIAEAPALVGTLEIVRAHRAGQVRCVLPDGWQDPSDEAYGKNVPLRSRRRAHRSAWLRHACVWGLLLYLIALVFAMHGLLPFSRFIRLPFDLVLRLAARLLA